VTNTEMAHHLRAPSGTDPGLDVTGQEHRSSKAETAAPAARAPSTTPMTAQQDESSWWSRGCLRKRMFLGRALVVLCVLIVCGGPFWSEAALPVVASVPANRPARIATRTKLLVLVIAGGSTARFKALRSMWLDTAERVAPLGVVVYLVSFGRETRVDNHTIVFRGADSLIPGVLNETIMAMDLIKRERLPGADFVHFLRTNLSSFLRFPLLLSFLSRVRDRTFLYAGYRIKNPLEPAFASGAGFLLNRASYDLLLKERRVLRFDLIDDVAVGVFMLERNIAVAPAITFCLIEEAKWGKDFRSPSCNKGHFLFRIKTGDHELDVNIWKHLSSKSEAELQKDEALPEAAESS
jgi:hypothetical protein